MKRVQTISALITLLILSLASVSSAGIPPSEIDIAAVYRNDAFTVPRVQVFHTFDSVSRVYVGLNLSDFVYWEQQKGKVSVSEIQISWEEYHTWDSEYPFTSGSVTLNDSLPEQERGEIIVELDVPSARGWNKVLLLTVKDGNSDAAAVTIPVAIDRRADRSGGYFLVTDTEGRPVFNSHFGSNDRFMIQMADTTVPQLFIRYYKHEFPLPSPPWSYTNVKEQESLTIEPDSFYTVPLTSGISPVLSLPWEGLYQFQISLEDTTCLTLANFGDGFPEITTSLEALKPLRYLTSQKEYEKLFVQKTYKAAVDSFWLAQASGQPQRARNLIRKFYNRVIRANAVFSCYTPGWRTDRGMIFIVHGPPSKVKFDAEGETWIYGEENNVSSVVFRFRHVPEGCFYGNPLLERTPALKSPWTLAVESWRR
ncbi:MAG: hypothetical protein Kow00127_25710 [Bacteroidales bacterium]